MVVALEIVGGGPFNVYYAPVSEPEPAIDDDEAALVGGNWNLVGATGDLSFDESGIKISNPQTLNFQRVLGLAGPRKAFRTEEDTIVEFTVLDLSAATYAWILSQVAPTTTPAGVGVAGNKRFGIARNLNVEQFAVLVRAPSSEMDGGQMQWWIPAMVNAASAEPTLVKGAGAALKVTLQALADIEQAAGYEFGAVQVQTAAAS